MYKITQALRPQRFESALSRTKVPDQDEQHYIARHETPDTEFRSRLITALGQRFEDIARGLDVDGIVIIHDFLSGTALCEVQRFFDEQIVLKKPDEFLGQTSFNGAVEAIDLSRCPPLINTITDPLVTALIAFHFGKVPLFANWRGYRLEGREPLLYRAWDWHTDQKRSEVKVMLLLTDVSDAGQPMEYIKGSHRFWWKVESQRDTKFTIEEALDLGSTPAITRCTGPAGTVIVFNTNGLHRGTRRPGERRDIISCNYVPDAPGGALFPVQVTVPNASSEWRGNAIAPRILRSSEEPQGEALKECLLRELPAGAIQERLLHVATVGSAQDSSPEETKAAVAEYNSTPRYDDIKPRYLADLPFNRFLAANARNDFRPDLDLPVRLGDKDVDRDIQLVAFRDAGPTTSAARRLEERLSAIDQERLVPPDELSLEAFRQLAQETQTHIHSLLSEPELAGRFPDENGLRRCLCLAEDLTVAFGWVDSLERVRTNLIFTYALWDYIHDTLRSHGEMRGSGAEDAVMRRLEEGIGAILAAYASVVLHDDLARRPSPRKQ